MFSKKEEIISFASSIFDFIENEYNFKSKLNLNINFQVVKNAKTKTEDYEFVIELDNHEVYFTSEDENKYIMFNKLYGYKNYCRKYKTLTDAKRITKEIFRKYGILTKQEEVIKDIIC